MSDNRKPDSEVLFGNSLNQSSVSMRFNEKPLGAIRGLSGEAKPYGLFLNEESFSKHMLLLGGIGTGKTNCMYHLMKVINENLTSNDVVIIFDTKGDFYEKFYQKGDVVISNDETACGLIGKNYWNLFSELKADNHLIENINEISRLLFAEACEKTTQLFFPAAARDIFSAILYHFVKQGNQSECTNERLLAYINRCTTKDLREMLLSYPEYKAMSSYISLDDSPQTQGVLSELLQIIRQIFIGNFVQGGNLGIRDLVRRKGGRRIFIEYDMSVGKVLAPIYSLLFDLAIKEAVSRKRSEGNVYFVTDEFRLLPYLEHIDDAVNFGRSLGVKFIIGIQNVEQIFDNYGEERGRSIMSGFSSMIAFRVNDAKSREYIKDFFGKNIKLERYTPTITTKGVIEEKREAYVIEDWNISNLKIGEAIIGFPEDEPFKFKFDLYE